MNFLDLFAGIGGFRLGMEMAGHECVGYVEQDPYCSRCKEITKHDVSEENNITICVICGKRCRQHARESYQAMYDTKGEWTKYDITTVTDDDIRQLGTKRRVDVITGGFPCQAFSIAGQRKGFQDTRGTLFFDIARFANILRPRYLFLENVKGLFSHDNGNTFETILRTLDELGYDVEWDLLNSKDFGVPQNRERVFIIGHLRGTSTRKVFPVRGNNQAADINVIGTTKKESQSIGQREMVYGADGSMGSLTATDYKQPKRILQIGNIDQHKRERKNPQTGRVYDAKGLSPSLTTMQGGGLEPKIVQPISAPSTLNKRQNGRRFKENGEPMFTLTSQDRHGVMVAGNVNPSGRGMNGQVYKSEGMSPTLTTNKGEGPKVAIKEATKKGYAEAEPGDSVNYSIPTSETRRGRVGKGIANTLDTGVQQGVVTEDIRIRKLTPRECFRLQGFPDELFERAAEVNSDSQLYKQAGNSVTVNVIYEIARKMR